MTLGEYIKQYRERKQLSQRQFAEKAGVSNGYIAMIERNTNPGTGNPLTPSLPKLRLIASAMGMTVHELCLSIDDTAVDLGLSSSLPTGALSITTQRIPLLGTIHAGEPTFADEDFESYVEVGANIRCDFALRVVGDSMINARIMDGDIVFIRQQDTVNDGEIAAVLIDDEATLKRVHFLPQGMVMLQAENPKYQPIVIGGADETRNVRILGKAFAFQSDVR